MISPGRRAQRQLGAWSGVSAKTDHGYFPLPANREITLTCATVNPVSPVEPIEVKRRSFRNFIASVRYAIEGFWAALQHEPSFREDLLFAVLLVPFAIILPLNAVSTALMIASLILILIVELLNSAIEWIIDYLRPERHPLAKRIKDMASAAVFLSYINCIVVWAIMLWPGNGVWTRVGGWFHGR
jgi:diacylglycerol kinase (ATP)